MKNQFEKMLLILGEISRDGVGILRKSTLILMMKNETEEMMSYSSGIQTDFNNEKQKECWGKSPEIV